MNETSMNETLNKVQFILYAIYDGIHRTALLQ